MSLIPLLAPLIAILVLGLVGPLRRTGRPAAFLSIAGALTALVAAVLTW